MADDEKLEAGAEAPAADAPEAEAAPEAVAEAPEKPTAKRTSTRKAKVDTPEPVEEEPSARVKGAKPAKAPVRTTAKTAAERGTYVRTPKEHDEQGGRRERRGVVVSDKGDKTITVRVDVMKAHPKYRKIVRRSLKLRVHDEQNQAHLGDTVRVVECRPMSRTKRWRLVEIVEVAK